MLSVSVDPGLKILLLQLKSWDYRTGLVYYTAGLVYTTKAGFVYYCGCNCVLLQMDLCTTTAELVYYYSWTCALSQLDLCIITAGLVYYHS